MAAQTTSSPRRRASVRWRFLSLVWVGVGAATSVTCRAQVSGSAPTAARPNIVFMLSDDQDWTGLSVQMHPDVPASKSDVFRTPNVARLAAQGMRFTNAYAPSPVCSPTRYSIQTGKSPAQLHWTKAAPIVTAADGTKLMPPRLVRHIAASELTIGEALRKAGYATAHYGKWHISGGGPGRHGYDEHDGNTSNRDAAPFKDPNPVDIFGMGERAIAFMTRQTRAGRPFFVQMSYHALHYPENAREKTQATYRGLASGRRGNRVGRAAITEDLDTGVGMVMDGLERLGIAGNTVVIYMSDNGGGGGGPRPVQGGKGSLWEGGIRVPFIVRGPGVASGTFCHVPIVGYDLLPTFCELAGLRSALPAGVEGGSLVQLLRGGGIGEVRRPREEIVFHFPHYQSADGPHSAIRLGDLKLIRFYETGDVRLFDLAVDLREQHDLAREQPAKAAALTRRLDAYLTAVRAQLPAPNPGYDPEKAAALTWQRRDAKRPKGRGRRR